MQIYYVGAAEVYAASNGVNEFLHITYCADEMGITIPKPFTLYVDNAALQQQPKFSVMTLLTTVALSI